MSITQLIKLPTDPKYGSSLVKQQKSNWTWAGAGTGRKRVGLVESSYHHDMRALHFTTWDSHKMWVESMCWLCISTLPILIPIPIPTGSTDKQTRKWHHGRRFFIPSPTACPFKHNTQLENSCICCGKKTHTLI